MSQELNKLSNLESLPPNCLGFSRNSTNKIIIMIRRFLLMKILSALVVKSSQQVSVLHGKGSQSQF